MKNPWVLLFAFVFLVACNNSDDNSNENATDDGPTITDVEDLNLVTGLLARETPDQNPFVLGNPNVFVPNNSVRIYPTIAAGIINIGANGLTISDIWVVPAEAEKIHQEEDFSVLYTENTYTQSDIDNSASLSIGELSSSEVAVNLEALAPGYYRVFVLVEGVLQWENLYIREGSEDIDDLIEFWN